MLFLGFEGDALRVYDPPRSVTSLSTAELLSIWDGGGITLDDGDPVSESFPADVLLVVVVCAASLALARRFCRPVLCIPVAACVTAVFAHVFMPQGFLTGRGGLDNIAVAYFPQPAPEIAYDEFRDILGRPDATVIDVRLPTAYARRHIPGAINVAISLGHAGLQSAMAGMPRESVVVLYCQSEQCGWSQNLAGHFLARGYKNVYVYGGGYNEWHKLTAPVDAAHGG